MAPGPVADEHQRAVLERNFPHDRVGVEYVRDREPHAGNGVPLAIELLRITDVDESEAAVEFVHADAIDAAHREALGPRHDAGRCHDPLGQRHGHLVADPDLQRFREFHAEHDVELAGLQACQLALEHQPRHARNGVFLRRIHAPDFRAAQLFAENHQRLSAHVRRRRDDPRIARSGGLQVLPAFEFALDALDAGVCGHGQQPVLELALETVHHGQHDNQHGYRDRDAEHRDGGDERYEAVGAARPHVAAADPCFEAPSHGRYSYLSATAGFTSAARLAGYRVASEVSRNAATDMTVTSAHSSSDGIRVT